MHSNKKKKYIILLFILVLGLSVGFALLQANLKINGSSKIKGSSWDIHFENLNVTNGSVALSTGDVAAVIQSSRTDITYTVTLNLPGDYYEFTVDAVNAGSVDGMVESVTSKLNNQPITTLPNYLNYSVTYETDDEIQVNHLLKAGETETYKVRIEFKKDISSDDLPNTVQNLTLDFGVVYVQASNDAITPIHPISLYSVLENEAKSNGLAREYIGEHKDSFIKSATQKIYHWYAETDDEGNEIQNKNNVVFAGFCWQMIRTTDTGGVKMIYSGVARNLKCSDPFTINISPSYYNNYTNVSPAYLGYMYNPNILIESPGYDYGSNLYGNDVTYMDGKYSLVNTSTTKDNNHHYSCGNADSICETVKYYYYTSGMYNYYIEISDGRKIEQVLNDMLNSNNVNMVDSKVKYLVDDWYENNLLSYSDKLEDTIFCNDRSILNLGGWDPNGGIVSNVLQFNGANNTTSLKCTNITDQFCLTNDYAKLKYPIALISAPEALLLNNDNSLKNGYSFWTMTPYNFSSNGGYMNYIASDGGLNYHTLKRNFDIVPVISLASGIKYITGNGSKDNPYIVQ